MYHIYIYTHIFAPGFPQTIQKNLKRVSSVCPPAAVHAALLRAVVRRHHNLGRGTPMILRPQCLTPPQFIETILVLTFTKVQFYG